MSGTIVTIVNAFILLGIFSIFYFVNFADVMVVVNGQ